jgi:uncharacterized protein (DUF58 family)
MQTLFTTKFRKCCAYLDETARRSWGSRFLGRRLDRRCAGGSQFVGHSDYTSGDDFRAIDWHVCARHDELLTKQYRGSEDRTVYLLLDCSPAMDLGNPSKFDAARRLAGALGYLALANLDRLEVFAISNRIVTQLRPLRGKRYCGQLFRFLDHVPIDTEGVDLHRAIQSFVHDRPRRGTTVVVSDLFDPASFEPGIDLLAKRGFPPYLLQVVAPSEAEPTLSGSVNLIDVFFGRRRKTYLEAVDLANYRRVFDEFSAGCRRYCARRGIGITQTRSDTPFDEAVHRMIRTSTARMYAS